ncbi:MAG: M23 family metallopeptidase [Nitrospirota bacterium]
MLLRFPTNKCCEHCEYWRTLFFLLGLFFLSDSLYADSPPPYIDIHQGEVIAFSVSVNPDVKSVVGEFRGESVSFFKSNQNEYTALIGADLAQPLEEMPFVITEKSEKRENRHERIVQILPTEFGVERFSVPKNKVDLDEKTAVRVEKEATRFKQTFSKSFNERLWQSAFIVPVVGKRAGTFGQKRVINGQEKNPHTGEDIKAPLGTEVIASNDGKVVLSGDFFFNGISIVIDHGGGLFTMYFHLSEIKVKAGDFVTQGEGIGKVGQTGRATGPHLHWGARLHGARVDPFALIKAISEMPIIDNG